MQEGVLRLTGFSLRSNAQPFKNKLRGSLYPTGYLIALSLAHLLESELSESFAVLHRTGDLR